MPIRCFLSALRSTLTLAPAHQAETAARGQAKASRIAAEADAARLRIEAASVAEAEVVKAKGNAESTKINAMADAEAEVMRAKGSKEAAELIGSSEAGALATCQRLGPLQHVAIRTLVFVRAPFHTRAVMSDSR